VAFAGSRRKIGAIDYIVFDVACFPLTPAEFHKDRAQIAVIE
jgi:hypothetical protein